MTQAGKPPITQEYVRERLNYDPFTGIVTWRTSRYPSFIGKEAGSIRAGKRPPYAPYRAIQLRKIKYITHNLIWLWMTGEYCPGRIDHIDGDSLNNKWENFRKATNQQNSCNARRRSDNKTGFKGVFRYSKTAKRPFRAEIMLNYKHYYLGNFETAEEAYAVRMKAAKKLHGKFAR